MVAQNNQNKAQRWFILLVVSTLLAYATFRSVERGDEVDNGLCLMMIILSGLVFGGHFGGKIIDYLKK